jgi:hypothetical protein
LADAASLVTLTVAGNVMRLVTPCSVRSPPTVTVPSAFFEIEDVQLRHHAPLFRGAGVAVDEREGVESVERHGRHDVAARREQRRHPRAHGLELRGGVVVEQRGGGAALARERRVAREQRRRQRRRVRAIAGPRGPRDRERIAGAGHERGTSSHEHDVARGADGTLEGVDLAQVVEGEDGEAAAVVRRGGERKARARRRRKARRFTDGFGDERGVERSVVDGRGERAAVG